MTDYCATDNRLCDGPCAMRHKAPWKCPACYASKKRREIERIEEDERSYKRSWERRSNASC